MILLCVKNILLVLSIYILWRCRLAPPVYTTATVRIRG